MPVVTLTTDFGTRDPYVAQVKGVLLTRCPTARIVDLGHELAPHDILEGALFLAATVPRFPPGTVHLAVVDPGVGSGRRAIAVALAVDGADQPAPQLVVCPDNGLLTLLARRSRLVAAVEIEIAEDSVAATFHGRDIFAPAAAALACGARAEELGAVVDPSSLVSLPVSEPRTLPDGGIRGDVIHFDRFGNATTNLRGDDLGSLDGLVCHAAGKALGPAARTYAERDRGEPLWLLGSTGYLEVAVREGSAADALGLSAGDPVELRRR